MMESNTEVVEKQTYTLTLHGLYPFAGEDGRAKPIEGRRLDIRRCGDGKTVSSVSDADGAWRWNIPPSSSLSHEQRWEITLPGEEAPRSFYMPQRDAHLFELIGPMVGNKRALDYIPFSTIQREGAHANIFQADAGVWPGNPYGAMTLRISHTLRGDADSLDQRKVLGYITVVNTNEPLMMGYFMDYIHKYESEQAASNDRKHALRMALWGFAVSIVIGVGMVVSTLLAGAWTT